MNYEQLLAEVRETFMKADVSSVSGHLAYQFNIEGESAGVFYAEVSEGSDKLIIGFHGYMSVL